MLALVAVLMRWRTLLVVLITVPTSLIAAAVVLDLLGETFNAITFAGLALALAVVVDDAVTGAENIARRLAQRRAEGSEAPIAATVLDATREIRSPLGYGALIALLVIVPLAIMEGRPGAFLAPLAAAYAVAVVAATILALTLTPALAVLLKPAEHGSPLMARLSGLYAGVLGKVLAPPRRGAGERRRARPRRRRRRCRSWGSRCCRRSRTATCSSGSTRSPAPPTRA